MNPAPRSRTTRETGAAALNHVHDDEAAALGDRLRLAGFQPLPDISSRGELVGVHLWRLRAGYVEYVTMRSNGVGHAVRAEARYDYSRPFEHGRVVDNHLGYATAAVTWLLGSTPKREPQAQAEPNLDPRRLIRPSIPHPVRSPGWATTTKAHDDPAHMAALDSRSRRARRALVSGRWRRPQFYRTACDISMLADPVARSEPVPLALHLPCLHRYRQADAGQPPFGNTVIVVCAVSRTQLLTQGAAARPPGAAARTARPRPRFGPLPAIVGPHRGASGNTIVRAHQLGPEHPGVNP
jgi:hypothetical protein